MLKKNEEVRVLMNKMEQTDEKWRKELEDLKSRLQEECTELLEQAQKEYQKRTSLARTVIEEKDAEISACRLKIDELRVEIESGAPGERKILALAEQQARRDLYRDTDK